MASTAAEHYERLDALYTAIAECSNSSIQVGEVRYTKQDLEKVRKEREYWRVEMNKEARSGSQTNRTFVKFGRPR